LPQNWWRDDFAGRVDLHGFAGAGSNPVFNIPVRTKAPFAFSRRFDKGQKDQVSSLQRKYWNRKIEFKISNQLH